MAEEEGEPGGVPHGETAGLRNGGRFRMKAQAAGLVDLVKDAERESDEAARGEEVAIGGMDEDVVGGPVDGEGGAVEMELDAESVEARGEEAGELGVAAGDVPGAVGIDFVFSLLLCAEGEDADAVGVGCVEAFDVGGEGWAEVRVDVAGG